MNISEFRPEWSTAPGSTILNLLERQGSSIEELSGVLDAAGGNVMGLLTGVTPITDEIAKMLAKCVGGTRHFWLKREAQYKEDFDRLQNEDEDDAARSWLRELPVNDLLARGWIQKGDDFRDQFERCLKFFDVANIGLWRNKYTTIVSGLNFRTSPTFKSELGAVAAWIRMGELTASKISCAPWGKTNVIRRLHKMRGVSRLNDPARFLPKLRTLCAECGIALIVNKAPKGCRASGATRFISSKKAIVLLSFRHLSNDHFWFTFFHELGHLVLHDKSKLFLEGVEVDMSQEVEANEFAEEVLIPPDFRDDFDALIPNHKNVIAFAKKIGIAPGLVVGQLQHAERLDRSKLSKLKRRYVWE